MKNKRYCFIWPRSLPRKFVFISVYENSIKFNDYGHIKIIDAYVPNAQGLVYVRKMQNEGREGPLAQWLEPPAHNGLVLGSNPRRSIQL